MANYDIFDENYYLSKYPFVQEGIDRGIISSGKEHFEKFGQKLGFTEVSRYYDENYYLANNPAVAAAVSSGSFASGLDHFIQFGWEQGLVNTSPDYDESFYLKRYPVLAPFVQNQTFKSGFEHFIKFGAQEGLYASTFFEPEYLLKNPEVAAAVKAAVFKTGGEHYRKFGQFEPNRSATFVGTQGSDVVAGFGVGKVEIIGIPVSLNAAGNRVYETRTNPNLPIDIDTLIGSQGSDTFVLGVGEVFDTNGGIFYQGRFGTGEPIIKNFDQQTDAIRLAGTRGFYGFSPTITMNGDFRITTGSGRGTAGIARIEGGANIPFRANRGRGLLIFSRDSVLDNFSEVEYLQKNPDVAATVKAGSFSSGLEHYTKFGQFEPNRSATFVGTDGNDIVTGFGNGKTEITGVDLDRSYAFGGEGNYFSNGSNEFDTLIGSQGADTFILAYDFTSPPPSQMIPDAQELYRGSGEARIRGFNPSQGDVLRLAGQASDYQISPVGADLVISKPGDTIAIIEGGANLNLRQLTFPDIPPVLGGTYTFLLG
ncbi:hypothetical protein QUB56_13675 [Microcoleus sp. AR_TQ3_B6]|uniref:hypothetical protein n=1 Tax=Microcoleus sp. AR_TQ3_B6 TaxID=3055284 RepID=UPI002FD1AC55